MNLNFDLSQYSVVADAAETRKETFSSLCLEKSCHLAQGAESITRWTGVELAFVRVGLGCNMRVNNSNTADREP